MNHDFGVVYFINILRNYRINLIIFIILGSLVGFIKSYFTPTIYRAQVLSFLPREKISNYLSHRSFNGMVLDLNSGSFSALTALSIITSRRMREDINEHFDLINKPDFELIDIIAYNVVPLLTEVKGTDPKLVKDIANYCVSNVDRINAELNLSPEKPLLKVIDCAESGTPISNNKAKGVVSGALFALISGMCIFILRECFDKLYRKKRDIRGA